VYKRAAAPRGRLKSEGGVAATHIDDVEKVGELGASPFYRGFGGRQRLVGEIIALETKSVGDVPQPI
jgi:hypothetical protein